VLGRGGKIVGGDAVSSKRKKKGGTGVQYRESMAEERTGRASKKRFASEKKNGFQGRMRGRESRYERKKMEKKRTLRFKEKAGPANCAQ